MNIPGITWRGESIDDIEILRDLPKELVDVLSELNGFILHHGAVHIRGANLAPKWHSIREAWRGENSFYKLYESILPTDIPFAEDQFGDQFILREGIVLRLLAETGEVELIADQLEDFFAKLNGDIAEFFKVRLNHRIIPGQLLLAYPPFCCKGSEQSTSLGPISANELIRFHADFAGKIRDLPEGGKIEFKLKD